MVHGGRSLPGATKRSFFPLKVRIKVQSFLPEPTKDCGLLQPADPPLEPPNDQVRQVFLTPFLDVCVKLPLARYRALRRKSSQPLCTSIFKSDGRWPVFTTGVAGLWGGTATGGPGWCWTSKLFGSIVRWADNPSHWGYTSCSCIGLG